MRVFFPVNESERLAALRRYNILDTPPEPRFDDIVQEACDEFGVPISLFTLIDEGRQWFKARVGIAVTETDRASSFCAHAVAIDAPLVVEDARHNELFSHNPLVTGPPRIAFYAGVPVRASSGEPLGALCIIDRHARCLSTDDFMKLTLLAKRIEKALEERRVQMSSSTSRSKH